MVKLAEDNNIDLYRLPPHTTHKLQPLDVGVFNPVQKAWVKQCASYLLRYGVGMQKQHVVREYMAAREGAFTSKTILNAWVKAGVRERPGNGTRGMDAFTDADFAPSLNTSTHSLAVPDTFPLELPSDFDPLPGCEPLACQPLESEEGVEDDPGTDDEDDDEDDADLSTGDPDGDHVEPGGSVDVVDEGSSNAFGHGKFSCHLFNDDM